MTRQRHNGRGCPVSPESMVCVWIRADPGSRALEQAPTAAKGWRWPHRNDAGDIIEFEQMGGLAG